MRPNRLSILIICPLLLGGCFTDIKDIDLGNIYYHNHQAYLLGGEFSRADDITRDTLRAMNGEIEKDIAKKINGEKYFIIYVSDMCSMCKENISAISYFESNAKDYVQDNNINIFCIFADEETDETTSEQSAFVQYLNRNKDFFKKSVEQVYESPFYLNGHISKDDLEVIEKIDKDNFLTPTFFFVDFSDNSPRFGVSEIFNKLEGETTAEKASFLKDCYTHSGKFGN